MASEPAKTLLKRLKISKAIIQAPMLGVNDSALAIGVSRAGGLGSLPCASLTADELRREVAIMRDAKVQSVHLNFFSHKPSRPNIRPQEIWKDVLQQFYDKEGLKAPEPKLENGRKPFDSNMCDVVEELRPEVVSFHFGLPEESLLTRVKRSGAYVLSSATTVAEARYLRDHGADGIIAQGFEAGGHRGMFLTSDTSTQVGTMALVPMVVREVSPIPVIAAGGISDGRGILAALSLGAAAAQIGSSYLLCPEAKITQVHRNHVKKAIDHDTCLTNIFSGRPARGIACDLIRKIGPISNSAPPFPTAGFALKPLQKHTEAVNRGDYSQMWCGQAVGLRSEDEGVSAEEMTLKLHAEMLEALQMLLLAH
ncbi:hypothetical protein AAMO2058_001349000 [Amorphochlora amoebiformis]|mmetsp:Transcript_11169/g.17654  ORF Transcript_11169/g.17654 Transcript_11169/m.17654 type:complete len:367 (-) Transcript_11169:189-1289(-)